MEQAPHGHAGGQPAPDLRSYRSALHVAELRLVSRPSSLTAEARFTSVSRIRVSSEPCRRLVPWLPGSDASFSPGAGPEPIPAECRDGRRGGNRRLGYRGRLAGGGRADATGGVHGATGGGPAGGAGDGMGGGSGGAAGSPHGGSTAVDTAARPAVGGWRSGGAGRHDRGRRRFPTGGPPQTSASPQPGWLGFGRAQGPANLLRQRHGQRGHQSLSQRVCGLLGLG